MLVFLRVPFSAFGSHSACSFSTSATCTVSIGLPVSVPHACVCSRPVDLPRTLPIAPEPEGILSPNPVSAGAVTPSHSEGNGQPPTSPPLSLLSLPLTRPGAAATVLQPSADSTLPNLTAPSVSGLIRVPCRDFSLFTSE